MAEDTYIVAVRRSQRALAPADWLDRLRRTDGVSVLGESYGRAQITADSRAVERVRHELGTFLLVEPLIEHHPSEGGTSRSRTQRPHPGKDPSHRAE